jgi:two-component sensor histidine kinase
VLLPAYKRRALVLVAAALVSNALLHAFPGCRAGAIEVKLTAGQAMSACLRVTDTGIGVAGTSANLDYGVAALLANLLEADLAYDRKDGRTIAEIVFPLPGPE